MIDFSNVETSDFEPVPNGTYTATIVGAEIKDTKSGTGQYISAQFAITTGKFENRRIWENFNIKNDNEMAVNIGLAKLKQLFIAAGRTEFKINGPEDLANITVGIQVAIKTDSYGTKNVINNFVKSSEVKAESADMWSGVTASSVAKGANPTSSEIPF